MTDSAHSPIFTIVTQPNAVQQRALKAARDDRRVANRV
jgi:hypothetical protein